jgi:hypothetical protein
MEGVGTFKGHLVYFTATEKNLATPLSTVKEQTFAPRSFSNFSYLL